MILQEDRCGDYVYVTISDVGQYHWTKHIPNQDAVLCCYAEDDAVLAIADGVGSCEMADAGAQAAVKAVRKTFEDVRSGITSFAADAVIHQIIQTWLSMLPADDINKYCSTLKAAIKISYRIMLISVGDGILAVCSNGRYILAPMDHPFFTNQTACLNADISYEDIWSDTFSLDGKDPFIIFACTDGVANGIEENCELALVQDIERNLTPENISFELQALIKEISEYISDDKTIGLIRYENTNAESHRQNYNHC